MDRGLVFVTGARSVLVGGVLERGFEFVTRVGSVIVGVLGRGFAFVTEVESVIGVASSLVTEMVASSSLVAVARSSSSEEAVITG